MAVVVALPVSAVMMAAVAVAAAAEMMAAVAVAVAAGVVVVIRLVIKVCMSAGEYCVGGNGTGFGDYGCKIGDI